ncbi:hypothetical protein BJ166DRAFT_603002, partial [Pestalotiopsis sp. NC0098]
MQVAATDLSAASSILWSDFLDGKMPSWFTSLPDEVQSYLTSEFGPKTVAATATTSAESSQSTTASVSTSTSASFSESTSESGAASTSPSSTLPSLTAASFITVTASSQSTPTSVTAALTETSDSASGFSRADKLAVGLGIPLAVALLVILALVFCLIRQRRRARRRPTAMESPLQSSDFLEPDMVPVAPAMRRSSSSNPFEDPPETLAATGTRHKRDSQRSSRTLTPV